MGANIVMLCRSESRGLEAQAEIKNKSGNQDVELVIADLSSQDSIRAFAKQFRDKHDKLDILINNAGRYFHERTLTVDGIPAALAVNYLGPFFY